MLIVCLLCANFWIRDLGVLAIAKMHFHWSHSIPAGEEKQR